LIYVLKPIARLVTFVLLLALAIVGLLAAVSGIVGVASVAEAVRLPEIRDVVGGWLQSIDGPSELPRATALLALGAVLLGLLLLAGALGRTPDRLVVMEERDGGTLGARPRALGQAADALIGRVRGITDRRVRVRARRGRGRLDVRATHTRAIEARAVESEVSSALAPLSDAFGVQTRVRPQLADDGRRVE
jgi:hypothetical protein